MFNITEYSNIIDEINQASLEIPFGNSKYQNINFVLNAELTTGRKLRHCLLKLKDRIAALRECYYNVQLENIDIEEMTEQLETAEGYDKRRLTIKLEQKQANRIQLEKMVIDCQTEIKDLYNAYKQLPKITREDFEKEEEHHFELKFARDIKLTQQFGGLKSIMSSVDVMGRNSIERVQRHVQEPDNIRALLQETRLK